MSRIGKKVITVPKGVTVTVSERELEVKGPKGTLRTPVPEGITFRLEDGQLQAERASDELAAEHGLARAYTRCERCGRPRGYLRKFKLCRICFRELALQGRIPGVVKSSW